MRPVLIFVALCMMAGCNKNKFTDKPQIKVKSVNSAVVSGNQDLVFTLDITDKEGDFSTFFGIKKSVASCALSNFTDTSGLFKIPQDFLDTKKTEGDIILTLTPSLRGTPRCQGPGGVFIPDTAIFRFWIRDKAGNESDTAVSGPIIIRQ